MMRDKLFTLIFAGSQLVCGTMGAAVNSVAYFRFGENDLGATSGTTVVATTDTWNLHTLGAFGVPSFSTDVALDAYTQTSSRFSVNFNYSGGSGDYLSNSIVTAAIDNFGIEAWVKPVIGSGGHVITYNGNSSTTGWGLYQSGQTLVGLFGGVTLFGSGSLPIGAWTHVALVRNNGTATIYVNGVAAGSTTSAPNVPTANGGGGFVVGAPGTGGTTENFNGSIDEVRIFTFNPGQFSTNDLLLGAAQGFTRVPIASFPGVYYGTMVWGDYDNDGRLDILVCGNDASGNPVTQVWRNMGNNTFSNINAGLPGVMSGSVAWGDYDNDGRLDILLTGGTAAGPGVAQVWRNLGNNTFSNINAGLPAVSFSAATWGDFDNDGRLDLLLTGFTDGGQVIADIWRNLGNGRFSSVGAGLTGVFRSAVACGDYDNDGRLDVLLAGEIADGSLITQVWRNLGNNTFSNINVGLPGITPGSVAWGDYDNDGRLDILLSGESASFTPVTQVWRNLGNNTFSNLNAGLTQVGIGSAAWGDFDNDGHLDVVLAGTVTGGQAGSICEVWRNLGGNTFTNTHAGVLGICYGTVACGDFNSDGKLDLLLTGVNVNNQVTSQIWNNLSSTPNSPPSAPSGLRVETAGSMPALTWNPSSDLQTPSLGLSYNLRIGTFPGGSDVLSPMAGADGTPRLARMGNMRPSSLCPLNLATGQTYYWAAQAVDTSFAASPFSTEQTFRTAVVLVPTNGVTVSGDLNADGIVSASEFNLVLSNYLSTSPWLYLTNLAGLGGTNVTFALSNFSAGVFTVEYSTNLSAWQPLGPATPFYHFLDTNAPSQPQRYYRLRWP